MRFSLDFIKQLYVDVSIGNAPVPEYSEWLEAVRGDKDKLYRIFMTVFSKLSVINTTIGYPQQFIIVPRYPLSKKPLISWVGLKVREYNDREVLEIKEFASRAGKLINSAVICKHLVVIDVDSDIPGVKELADVRTRRGYHLVFYLPKYEAVKVFNQTKYVFSNGVVSVEFISGSNYLWSYPIQSRYLLFINGVANVKSYSILSDRLRYALASADLTPITATLDDVESKLKEVLVKLGFKGYAKSLSLEGVERESYLNDSSLSVNPKESKFNANPLTVIGGMELTEFVKLCARVRDRLPVCFREALLGNPTKGSRYYHLRLLLAVLPFFVSLSKEELEELAKDFGERTNSRSSEVREWVYHSKYFTGRASGLIMPSRFGVPQEAWTYFKSVGYCSNCPAYGLCRGMSRKGIVDYLTYLISNIV